MPLTVVNFRNGFSTTLKAWMLPDDSGDIKPATPASGDSSCRPLNRLAGAELKFLVKAFASFNMLTDSFDIIKNQAVNLCAHIAAGCIRNNHAFAHLAQAALDQRECNRALQY